MTLKKPWPVLLMAFFIFCAEAPASGIKIYMAVNGSDLNPGTRERPLASLSGAISKVRNLKMNKPLTEPVEIIVEDGEYRMTGPVILTPEDSGSEGAPLVIKADVGAHPHFCGGKVIEGFEKVSETLWRARIPEVTQYGWTFDQLYVNGTRAVRAKSPNRGFYFLKGTSEIALEKADAKIPELAVQKLALHSDGASCLLKFTGKDFDQALITLHHKWNTTRKRMVGYEKDSSTVFIVGQGMKPWNLLDHNTRYVLENYRAALDTCGEWFLDPTGYLYYMPNPGETVENTRFVAPVADHFILIQGDEKTGEKVKNIRFEGLTFQHSGYRIPQNGNEPAQAAAPVDAVVMADFAANIQLLNCEITHTGTNAVWFRNGCTDCRVEHCYFHELGAGGVKIGTTEQPQRPEDLTQRIVIDNNIIRSGGYVFPCAVGIILFNASDNQVTHNEIADFRYSGISVGWVWGYSYSPTKRNKIEYNHIHHLGWGELCDMGGVYCLGSSEGTTVSNNVIHHVCSFDYGGWGLYTDEGSTGIVMENNLVYGCKSSAFHQHYGKENIIRNNIFSGNRRAQLEATRVEDHLSFTFNHNIIEFGTGNLLAGNWDKINLNCDSNCYWDPRSKDIRFGKLSFAEWKKSGKDIHSIIADPGFVNPSAYDFRIKNRSVLRKTGFKEFDYTKAGVYGSEDWKALAAFDLSIAKRFDDAVMNNENRR